MKYWINTISRNHVRRGVAGSDRAEDLSFIVDKTHWGYTFRFGLFEIPEADFELIRNAMMKP